MIEDIFHFLEGQALSAKYGGYETYPITVSYGRVVLAEFQYGDEVVARFLYDQRQLSRIAWDLKKNVFLWLYEYGVMRGIDPLVIHKVVHIP